NKHGNAVAHFRHDFGERLDGSPSRFRRAAAMVGYEDSVDAVLDAQFRILVRVDSFNDEFSRPEFSNPIDERPIHGRIGRAHAGHVDTVEHWPFVDARTRPVFVTRGTLAQVLWTSAQVRLTVAASGIVDRERDHCTSRCLYSPQQLLAGVPRTWSVQ